MASRVQTTAASHSVSTSAEVGGNRPKLAFPYVPLDTAIEVAALIHGQYGISCDFAQLAAGLRTTTASSKFRMILSAARMFGLIKAHGKTVTLTDLGMAIMDPDRRDEAKAEAFLAIPLYAAIHEQFDGKVLPPGAGLEGVIRSLGVTAKSAARARQILQRSADTAGFFRSGEDRLVRPALGPAVGTTAQAEQAGDSGTATGNLQATDSPDTSGSDDELLSALWSKLPSGTEFPEPLRGQWLKMMEMALTMIYGPAQQTPTDAQAA